MIDCNYLCTITAMIAITAELKKNEDRAQNSIWIKVPYSWFSFNIDDTVFISQSAPLTFSNNCSSRCSEVRRTRKSPTAKPTLLKKPLKQIRSWLQEFAVDKGRSELSFALLFKTLVAKSSFFLLLAFTTHAGGTLSSRLTSASVSMSSQVRGGDGYGRCVESGLMK